MKDKTERQQASLKNGQLIIFSAIDDLSGLPLELQGTVQGDFEAVRKKWPIEQGEADIYMYLIAVASPFGNRYHAVHLSEVLHKEAEQ